MLYKKYHRKYISQFKIGTKFKFEFDKHEGEIILEPFIDEYREILIAIEFISDDKSHYWSQWTIVYADGRLRENKDAIQKISQEPC